MTEKIRAYIAKFPYEKQVKLTEIYEIIKAVLPQAAFEDIRWNMPSFYWRGYIVHFAAAKKHIGLYIGTAAMAKFHNQLGNWKCGKSTIQLPYDEAWPCDLIQDIVRFNVAERMK